MSRLIDAEELKSAIRNEFPDLGDRIRINNIINEQPTIDVVAVGRCKGCWIWTDAVTEKGERRMTKENIVTQNENGSFHFEDELIRCKNCKRRNKYMICPMWDQKLSDYDYCSYGERKEDETD